MYRAAFAHLQIPASYEAHRVPRGDDEGVRRTMRNLAAVGGGNVTVPHKEVAARWLDARTTEVEHTGACNCFWLDEQGRLAGDNTDVTGFLAAAADLEGLQLDGGWCSPGGRRGVRFGGRPSNGRLEPVGRPR
jgi:shikimate dehydrogenase